MKLRRPTARHREDKAAKSVTPRSTQRLLLLSLVLVVIGFVGLLGFAYHAPRGGEELTFDRLVELAERGQVKRARLLDEDAQVVGHVCTEPRPDAVLDDTRPPASPPPRPCPGPARPFWAHYPRSDVATSQLIDRLQLGGTSVVVDRQTSTGIAKLLATFVFPLLLLANLLGLILLSRPGDAAISDVARFGTLRRRRDREQLLTGVTFADVGGASDAVAELQEVVDYLSDPERFQAYGAAVPRGVLLFGPPGCGKTLLARAVAGECKVPFFAVSGTEFVESLVGVGAARVRDLFDGVRAVAPAIVFIDEIDAVGRRRSGEGSSGGEREQTLNQLLVELDGFDASSGIVLMGATNRADILDTALLRPGRFDRHVYLDPPDLAGRQHILELHTRGKPIAPETDLSALARRTSGFTGADLANVVNEGTLLAIRASSRFITEAHFSEAVQRVLHGSRRRGTLMAAHERRRLAVHEAGHVVVAAALGLGSELDRVSIVGRERILARTSISGAGDRVLWTEAELTGELTRALAGVAAEVAILGDASTTAEDDVERATWLAREVAGRYGLTAKLGRIRLFAANSSGETGDSKVADAVSGATLAHFDAEVRRLVDEAEAAAASLIGKHSGAVERIASVLDDQETIEGRQLQNLMAEVRDQELSSNGSASRSRRRPRTTSSAPNRGPRDH